MGRYDRDALPRTNLRLVTDDGEAMKIQAVASRLQVVLPDLSAAHVEQHRTRIDHFGVIDELGLQANLAAFRRAFGLRRSCQQKCGRSRDDHASHRNISNEQPPLTRGPIIAPRARAYNR